MLSIRKHAKCISVSKADLIDLIERMDADGNGRIDLDEVIGLARAWKEELKTARKYWKG